MASLIPEAFRDATIIPVSVNPDWRPDLDEREPTVARAAHHIAMMIAEMKAGSRPHWLTISGLCGTGKTMLAKQLFDKSKPVNPGAASLWVHDMSLREEDRRRPRCVWLTAADFAKRIREKEFDLPEYLRADWLVVIDDLGAERDPTAFVADSIYRLCNGRMGKWTVFTSNLDLPEIARQIDERVASRLIRDGNIFHRITAKDYALRKT